MRIVTNQWVFMFGVLMVWPCYAQPMVIGAGPRSPYPLTLTGGQVTYIYANLDGVIPTARAEGYPLPRSLAGVSVWIGQTEPELRMPLFSVEPFGACPYEGCNTVAAIRVQVPYEFFAGRTPFFTYGRIWVEANGKKSPFVTFVLRMNNVELVGICPPRVGNDGLPCRGAVWHEDGGVVSAARPARPGEPLVMYGYGFGLSLPLPVSGIPADGLTPQPPAFLGQLSFGVRLAFQFLPNFRVEPRRGVPDAIVTPDYVGFVPGMVGLYQMNFRAPTPTVQLASCSNWESNVTLYLTGQLLVDAGFCMAQ